MKLPKILVTTVLATCFTATTALAVPFSTAEINQAQQESQVAPIERKHLNEKEFQQKYQEFRKDPIKALQGQKEKINSLQKEGKITKEKADAINARLDAKIKEIQEFNKLTLQQKKDKLISNFQARLDKKVKAGKLTQDQAITKINAFTEKIKKWDGQGYPMFHGHGHGFKDKARQDQTKKQ